MNIKKCQKTETAERETYLTCGDSTDSYVHQYYKKQWLRTATGSQAQWAYDRLQKKKTTKQRRT